MIELSGEVLRLLPQKAVYWQQRKILLLADLHLGKIGHFRRAGIPLPVGANRTVLEGFIDMLRSLRPDRVVFLGDLFHSHYNYGWEDFGEVIRNFPMITFDLVSGNHDILGSHQYLRKGISVHQYLDIAPFHFTHEPCSAPFRGGYNLAGHLHPGISLYGKGKQSLTLPCFYFGADYGVLPSFGVFTGLYRLEPKKDDRVFVIAEDEVIQVS